MLYYKDENICGEIASPYFSRLRTISDGVTLGERLENVSDGGTKEISICVISHGALN